jgi:hypothetical protein
MLPGHSSHDGCPIAGLKHTTTAAAIVRHRPLAPEIPPIPPASPFALAALVAAVTARSLIWHIKRASLAMKSIYGSLETGRRATHSAPYEPWVITERVRAVSFRTSLPMAYEGGIVRTVPIRYRGSDYTNPVSAGVYHIDPAPAVQPTE